MLTVYGILKFLHVLSVIFWIGGIGGLSVITLRVARERNREALSALLRHATFYGQWLVGPASLVVLLSGLAMVGSAHIGFGTFWVLWGFGGVVVHFLMGGFVLRKRTMDVARLASLQVGADNTALAGASRRLWQMQLLYLVLLASVVAAMVLKPTL